MSVLAIELVEMFKPNWGRVFWALLVGIPLTLGGLFLAASSIHNPIVAFLALPFIFPIFVLNKLFYYLYYLLPGISSAEGTITTIRPVVFAAAQFLYYYTIVALFYRRREERS